MDRRAYDIDRYINRLRLCDEELAGKPIKQETIDYHIDYHIEKIEFFGHHADTPDSRVETHYSMVCHDAHLASLHWWQCQMRWLMSQQMDTAGSLAQKLAAGCVASPERVVSMPASAASGDTSQLSS